MFGIGLHDFGELVKIMNIGGGRDKDEGDEWLMLWEDVDRMALEKD